MEPNKSQSGGLQNGPVNSQADAAANILRMQIDSMFEKEAQQSSPQQTTEHQQAAPQTQTTAQQNPFQRTHSQEVTLSHDEQWKKYHSAWQNYYQKYYSQQLERQKAEQQNQFFSNQPQTQAQDIDKEDISVTKDTALAELRQQLLGNVKQSAEKVKKSRHFRPLIAALVVIMVFSFLQYNRTIFAAVNAYVSPGAINPNNIIVDYKETLDVGPESKLIIPKINVDVPVIYDIGYDHDSQMKAMENGVAHFGIPGANSKPGQVGNTVLSGHSSNDLFDPGIYKFVFAQLEKLTIGDTLYANYEGVRYTYKVTKTEVVKPTEVSKLIYETDKPVMTLITCTPLGTALNRLLVTAEQVSPSPTDAKEAPKGSGETQSDNSSDNAPIPGNSPTLLERLFGRS